MLVTMKRPVFDTLDDVALGWACIEPTIQQIRGKELNVKSQVYAQLTAGQRGLLMFWVLYGHARNGVAQFYSEVEYLLAHADLWSELKLGLSYFGDDAMLRLIEKMEGVYSVLVAKNRLGGAELRSACAQNLHGDSELPATVAVDRLDVMYNETAPATLKRISAYIRKNPGEFVQIED